MQSQGLTMIQSLFNTRGELRCVGNKYNMNQHKLDCNIYVQGSNEFYTGFNMG